MFSEHEFIEMLLYVFACIIMKWKKENHSLDFDTVHAVLGEINMPFYRQMVDQIAQTYL